MIGISVTVGCEPALKVVRIRAIAVLALILSAGTAAGGQATPTVPATDPVYGFVDRLIASRLIDTAIFGQRAMSRREVGRLLAEARTNIGSDSGWFGERLQEYAREFPPDVQKAPRILSGGMDLLVADSPSRGIEADGNGAIEVFVNPLLSNRLGRPYANGSTAAVFARGSAGVTPWLTFDIEARESRLANRGGLPSRSVGTVERAYGRALWRNVSVLVGRDHMFLGQGMDAGLMSSINARGVNQVRLASDRPYTLPGFLDVVGPLHSVILLGDLGSGQYYPHTRLLAYRVSARPRPRFEIGVGLSEQVGGQGSPPGTFMDKATDAFPLFDAVIRHRTFLFSNKFVGADMRLTVPGMRGLQLYMEGAFDDFDLRRARSVFTEDAAWVWGASTSCLPECGPFRITGEYHATGLRYYTHGIIRNGFTVDRQIIGDQLGPRGKGAYASLDVERAATTLGFHTAYEARSGDKYSAVSTTPDDADFRFVMTERHPIERRWRAWSIVRKGRSRSRVSFRFAAGVERVENFAHVDNVWRTNWMTDVGVEYRLKPVTGK